MMILLHGEDNYSSRQKLNSIIDKFKKKDLSSLNFISLNGTSLELSHIKQNILAAPFMADKRLVVIENLLSQQKENLQEDILELLAKGIPKSSVVIFWEEKELDKRKKLSKFIIKNSQAEEFKYLFNSGLNNWIRQEVKARGGIIASNAVNKLASYVGSDLWQMSNEIDKLIIYKKDTEIIDSDIDLLIKAKLDTNIFNFIDAIGNKNKNRALNLLHDQLASGENIQYLLSMLNYQFRNLLIIKELTENGFDQYNVSRRVKMHPYVVRKTIQQSFQYDLEGLKIIYRKLLDLDVAIKTGQIDSVLGLDLLVIALCA